MPIPELLRTLLTASGPSGHETRVAGIWREAAAGFAEVTADAMGSSFARVRGTEGGPTVVLMGHVDECGLVVTHVEEGGLLSFAVVGGYNPEVLVGQRVTVLGRGGDVPGLVMRKRIAPEDLKDSGTVRHAELHVDIGARDAGEARGLVRVGDAAVLVGEPLELPNGRIVSKALDNRAGAYVVVEALRRIAEAGGAAGDVVGVATVQEEIGLYGARASAYALQPDVAIAVDITPASDVPGGDPRASGKVGLGDGPALDRAPSLNPRLIELLVDTAEREGIPLCFEISTRLTHTDADEIHLSRAGVPTALVSVPLRYTHTPVETAQLSDVEDSIRLLVATVRQIDASTSFAR
ncbi:MAG TPA: M20/M25/M40 family metallo-hydrolase [Gaiellaceae bacterium]|nr:M20/M25/M40 family metallo-hydrolase [Gaiellaceae bacterium]